MKISDFHPEPTFAQPSSKLQAPFASEARRPKAEERKPKARSVRKAEGVQRTEV